MKSIKIRVISIATTILAVVAMLICVNRTDKEVIVVKEDPLKEHIIYMKYAYESPYNEPRVLYNDIGEKEEEHNLLKYIIDVIYINDNQLYCDTATLNGYSGKMNVNIASLSANISIGKTYIITTKSLMSISKVPTVTAIDIEEASNDEINELDNIRKEISNYNECIVNYNKMSLNDIIEDANDNYVYWSQEERKEFISYINNLGYNESKNGILKVIIYETSDNTDDAFIVE